MTDKPMKVNSECQQYRKSRIGKHQINLLHLDERIYRNWQSGGLCWPAPGGGSGWWECQNVKSWDAHYKAGIRDYQQQMKLLLEKMVRQTEGSAEAQRKLQADLRNKKLAHEIDKWVGIQRYWVNTWIQRNEIHLRVWIQPVQTLPGPEQPVWGKGEAQQDPGQDPLNFMLTLFSAYFWSRNFFVTNRCLNHGQERVRRICNYPETPGGCSWYSCILNKAFRFSAQQLERDATNMIRRAENAMRTKWANTNNAFK